MPQRHLGSLAEGVRLANDRADLFFGTRSKKPKAKDKEKDLKACALRSFLFYCASLRAFSSQVEPMAMAG